MSDTEVRVRPFSRERLPCRARVEIRVYRTTTGEIMTTWVGTGAGADLSEVFAAKKVAASILCRCPEGCCRVSLP